MTKHEHRVDSAVAVDPADTLTWVDHGVAPPLRLPLSPEAMAAYLTDALGHAVYERWTWKRLVDVYGTLPDARRAKPTVCRLLIDAPAAVEAWQRGRLQVTTEALAPEVGQVVASLLRTNARRFRASGAAAPATPGTSALTLPETSALPASLNSWLQRTGRLHNPHRDTNTLGAGDDHAALEAFLRERAGRSRHTWRAYAAELQRLVHWCLASARGPLSDLTRQDLLVYSASLRQEAVLPSGALNERSRARALAVVASLFTYWHDTGYLLGNPAIGLLGGSRSRTGFVPQRFVPAALLQACDAWVARSVTHVASDTSTERVGLAVRRRAAVWTLYRYSGARLAELVWNPQAGVEAGRAIGLPRLAVDERGDWLLTVMGKGNKERSVPLPRTCDAVLRAYRLARGLPAVPGLLEKVAPIHGEKGGHLGARGLYDEVKAVLDAVAAQLQDADAAGATLLRSVSPHWLRHAYARTLVVDQRVPLPAAQALLGHASVQTTAAYARTDLSQLREFVNAGFAPGLPQ